MNFTAYIERQKNIIRGRHESEVRLYSVKEAVRASESERILSELLSLRGLNKEERHDLRKGAVL